MDISVAALDLLGTAIPLVVGGFLAGLFTYWFEVRRTRQERRNRRDVLLESLKRELSFIPRDLPDYRAGATYFLPPIRTVVGANLLDGNTLDWATDEAMIQALLEFIGVAAIYNELVGTINSGQAFRELEEASQRHWHGQLLGVHATLLDAQANLSRRLGDGQERPSAPSAATPVETATANGWTTDAAHSVVSFSARHMGIMTVPGRFGSSRIYLDLNEGDLTHSNISAVIDAASVSTGDDRRDEDLRSDHFLYASQFPEIRFQSTSIERQTGDAFLMQGDLTIRDVTRAVEIDVTMAGSVQASSGKRHLGFSAKTTINRTDWGLTWNVPLETGGWLVSEDVTIVLEVEATKA